MPSGQPNGLCDFNTGCVRDVLTRVMEVSGWADRHSLPDRTARAVAFYCSHMANPPRWCRRRWPRPRRHASILSLVVADVGNRIINPGGAENQVQGAELIGLGSRWLRPSPRDRDRVVQAGFGTMKPLRINLGPPADGHFLSTAHPASRTRAAICPAV